MYMYAVRPLPVAQILMFSDLGANSRQIQTAKCLRAGNNPRNAIPKLIGQSTEF
jgi:hypothetical protein